VKIPPTSDNVRFLPSGADRDPAGSAYDQQQGQKRKAPNPYAAKKAQEPVTIEVTSESVNAAMETFQADEQARAQGIAAEVQGTGPGLKVVLKDGSGAFIRSLTGEEFLRLHETTQGTKTAGKLLDQKA
jgi:hypothetical protein